MSEIEPSPEKVRYYLIDALRGIAACLVTFLHIYVFAQPKIHDPMAAFLPWIVDQILTHGEVGVPIFFIISGFVITHSIGLNRVTLRYAGNFALRRQIRLDPPYWAVIVLSLVLVELAHLVMPGHAVERYPPLVLLANFTYVSFLFNVYTIVGVAWTLVLEIQFYFLFIILYGLGQWLSGRSAKVPRQFLLFLGFGVTGLASLAYGGGAIHPSPYFFGTWYLFCVGSICYLLVRKRISPWWGYAYLGPVAAYLFYSDPLTANTGTIVATMTLILVAAYTGNLERWLSHSIFQYFGRISYSLYLMHVPIGLHVLNLMTRYKHPSVLWSAFTYLTALGASIFAAEVLHRLFEGPSMRLARRLKPKPVPEVVETSQPVPL